ncbi:MAG: PBP1A family penicillin-binding protein, partial [Chloroflexi bacterium]|nr:PBP1A family penicillin-binding protein [Chloroflexota bacterium]
MSSLRCVLSGRRLILLPAAIAAMLMGALIYQPAWLLPLPGPDAVRGSALAPSSAIVDRRGHLLYELIDPEAGPHHPLSLAEMPLALRQAVIATEDAEFYAHPGFSVRGIVRALWLNMRHGQIVSGGSTITQQVARMLLMAPAERFAQSWMRKAREVLLAYHLTRTMSKDEVLALYLNQAYFGNMAYGVEAAAQRYFGKPLAQLDLAESALLAGLPQAPEAYNPLTNLAAAKARQQQVLDLMVRAGYLDRAEADRAAREPLHLASARFPIEAPHFAMLVRAELAAALGEEAIQRGGLRVETTLDLHLQRAAEGHVRRHIESLNRETLDGPGHNVRNAAVVLLDPRTGAVRAMVGSPDFFDARIDGAVNAALSPRQSGSAIKPLTYAAAFERGYTPASMMRDELTSFVTDEGTPYTPINYDYRFHGLVSLRRALACSYNVVAVKLLDEIGVEALVEMGKRLGIADFGGARGGLGLGLGSGEATPLALATAYAAFANGGQRVVPRTIERVLDAKGNTVYQPVPQAPAQVLDPRVAYLVTHALSDAAARMPAFGQGSPLDTPFRAAVKTGTTTDWRDNWTVGYTADWVCAVWVGNANGEPMQRISGVSGAAPIWRAVMTSAHARPGNGFERPPGLVEVEVCAQSGLLPSETCPYRLRELFPTERAPDATCTMRHEPVSLADALPPTDERAVGHSGDEGDPAPELATASRVGVGRAVGGDPPYLSEPAPNSRFAIVGELPVELQQLRVSVAGPAAQAFTGMQLWVNGALWHTWTEPPYSLLWPLTPGQHVFRPVGLRASG